MNRGSRVYLKVVQIEGPQGNAAESCGSNEGHLYPHRQRILVTDPLIPAFYVRTLLVPARDPRAVLQFLADLKAINA